MELEIDSEALVTMHKDATASYPNECCGFFYGYEKGELRHVTTAVPVTNSKEGDKRRRFEISPQDYLRAEQYALENELTLLGIYHSHPDHPAKPSEHDLKQAVPYFSYVIIAVDNGETSNITSWQLNKRGIFQEEKIKNLLTDNVN
ncbi:M67 family metallopeptidase [Fulvivirgaceae bacterium BMA10]|uniref:M67 family metallopeptidase n=1 Tax=Splendidivirga corallicola TaxID=3051826 RepID=A0ABT8KW53_9BACT|nr:M67 family metallopeptidase [Fulvivirgaceae bacterium BMA10]